MTPNAGRDAPERQAEQAEDSLVRARHLDAACNRFEQVWQTDQRPRVEDFLAGAEAGPGRAALLRELILLDVEYRRKGGEQPGSEEYARRFPELDQVWLAAAVAPDTTTRNTEPSASVAALAPPPAAPGSRFAPGVVVARRYRIVAALGKGGMGEVYRADDLHLGRPVALKFLPAALARDADRLERFRREVLVAREVSHPNVCRVHDLGEWRGQPFLSMEYIDGEDLAALLRRIGRLPEDKAVEVARQLCLGLAAAHDRGVLHRDIKPRNVMLDGKGRVRIMDFGLAGFAEDFQGREVTAGTPAYQAPEQLAGREVTAKSDLYALGLILYELFTGRKAFEARSRAELLVLQAEKTPTSPGSLVGGIDPRVERLILRCLERDPADRPASAVAVAAALPGGDALAAALAAGTMPSPETVAASSTEGSLSPPLAATLLAGILLGVVLIALLSDRVKLFRLVSLTEKSPDVLRADARRIIKSLGYTDPPVDSSFRIYVDKDYLKYVRDKDAVPERWEILARGRPAAVTFWYEQSPAYLDRTALAIDFPGFPGAASPLNPPRRDPGMVCVFLDPQGRLIEFHAVPPALDTDQGPWPECDWKRLFTEAGLEYADFKDSKVASIWVPDVSSDRRQAWLGVFPERQDFPLRVEAAAYHGKPVYFRLVGDWTKPVHGPGVRKFFSGTILYTFTLLTVVLVVGTPFAWRNWKLGRGDRRGALRVAVFLFGIHFLMWVLFAEHVPHLILETSMLWGGLGLAFHCAICLWVGYLALEPAVRRRWPWRIVSWTRVVAGRFRDPLVGRDILLGGLLGVALVLGQALQNVFPTWLGLPPPLPLDIFVNALTAAPTRIAFFALGAVSLAVTMSLTFFALFFVLGLFLRRNWLAALALFVILLGLFWQSWWDAEYRWIALAFTSLGTLLAVFVMHCYGLLPLTFGFIFHNMLTDRPITYDLSAWYFPASLCYILVLVVLAVYGFFLALGGRPLFRAAFFHEE